MTVEAMIGMLTATSCGVRCVVPTPKGSPLASRGRAQGGHCAIVGPRSSVGSNKGGIRSRGFPSASLPNLSIRGLTTVVRDTLVQPGPSQSRGDQARPMLRHGHPLTGTALMIMSLIRVPVPHHQLNPLRRNGVWRSCAVELLSGRPAYLRSRMRLLPPPLVMRLLRRLSPRPHPPVAATLMLLLRSLPSLVMGFDPRHRTIRTLQQPSSVDAFLAAS